MKRSSAILKSLVVLGVLTFGLAASGSVIISQPVRYFPPRPLPFPLTNHPPILITNRPPIIFTNLPPIRITNLPPIFPPTPITHCTPAPAGLVGWWTGEGNADDVVGGNNGTLEGGATFAPGKVGQGFRLDGTNSYVQIPDADALKPANVTVEAWVWLDPNITTPRSEYVIFKRNSWSFLFEGYSLLKESLSNGDGTYTDRFSFLVTSGGDQVITYSTTVAQRGVWYHVAGTYDGNELKLWVNGVAEASAIAGFALDYGDRPVFIGTSGEPEPYNGKLAGIIDEASIYNRALSAAEMQAIYHAGSAGKCAPACAPAPSGLVSWWPAEENANDIVGGNNGTAQNVTYANGEVGQAFVFDGSDASIKIPASSNLDVGLGDGFTLETWVKPSILSVYGWLPLPIFEWNTGSGYGDGSVGVQFVIGINNGSGNLAANIEDTATGFHVIYSADNIMNTNAFQHVALTYDKTTGMAMLYRNGVVVATNNLGAFTPQTSFDLYLGQRPAGPFAPFYFAGALDEPGVYNRALSASEINAIYQSGSAGKCTPSTACVPAPSGLAGWWQGEGNANDVLGMDSGVAQDITYATGKVGQAFVFNGSSSQVEIPVSASLDVGTDSSGFTIETWVNPSLDTVNEIQSLVQWNQSSGYDPADLGVHLEISGNYDADLHLNVLDTTVTGHHLYSAPGIMKGSTWQHVAATYDNKTGNAVLYYNGVAITNANLGTNFTPQTAMNLYLGARPAGVFINHFKGMLDEPGVYYRPLSASEINAIYDAGSAGKCAGPFPPVITVPPSNQSTDQGSNVVLSVTAIGTGPFSYQWSFNGTNISGATNDTLTLSNLHSYLSGCYTVTITTPYGTITSSCATVTVMAQNILVYKYSGTGRVTTAGQAFAYAYSGRMFFIPDSTNGTFVGWGTIKGKKQYWVNPLSDYLLITISGVSNQTFTVLGQAGQEIDTNGYPHIWSYLHKGKNTPLTIGKNMYFSFPNNFSSEATHVYPDAQTGNPILSESFSIYTFVPLSTQAANNTGQTMTDLVNALTASLDSQGYQRE